MFRRQIELLELINEELIVEKKNIRAAGDYLCTWRKICVMVMDHIQLLQCMDVLVLDYLHFILLSTLGSLLDSNTILPLLTTIRDEVFTSSSK